MAKKTNTPEDKVEITDPFEGFTELTKSIIPGLDASIKKPEPEPEDDDEFVNDEEEVEIGDDLEDEPEEEIEKPTKTKKSKKTIEDEVEEEIEKKASTEELDIEESELIDPFFDMFAEELGWEVTEEDKPKSMKDLIGYMNDVIETNSKPNYSSELSERFDKYLANGGDPSKFMDVNFGSVDYKKIDVTKEDNQRRVLREYYKQKGFADPKIDKYLERLDNNDELEDEAKDALVELQANQEEQQIRLEKEQEKQRRTQLQEHENFVKSVDDYVAKVDAIGGLKLSKKDKEEILPYIFKVEKDGKTRQQKDYEEHPIEYLVATAFYYKNKEALKKRFDNIGLTGATEKFKQKQQELLSKQKKHKSDIPADDLEDGEDWLSAITGGIQKPKR